MGKSQTTKILFFAIFVAVLYFYFNSSDANQDTSAQLTKKITQKVLKAKKSSSQEIPNLNATSQVSEDSIPKKNMNNRKSAQALNSHDAAKVKVKGVALKFVLEDGLAVVHGDLIVGALVDQSADPDKLKNSHVVLPHFELWPTSVIPFHIESDFINPDRVLQALALFEGTAVEFVPYTNQKAAIFFTNGTVNCKSYVGYVGNLQPILLSPNCKVDDIAHEILHALGFIHEQNRIDRDNYIDVMMDNIEEGHKENFEKLPGEFMVLSGLAQFDFESLMIYPDWMFAKTGSPTMQSKSGQQIIPSKGISRLDRERLDRAYRGR